MNYGNRMVHPLPEIEGTGDALQQFLGVVDRAIRHVRAFSRVCLGVLWAAGVPSVIGDARWLDHRSGAMNVATDAQESELAQRELGAIAHR